MTDQELNKLRMYIAVQEICWKHKEVWSELPAFDQAFTDFQEILKNIEQMRLIQKGHTGQNGGNQQEKEEESMINQTVKVASAVYAYAKANNNSYLKAKVDYSPSQLRRSSDTLLRARCRKVQQEAQKVLPELSDYGISHKDLQALQASIEKFSRIIKSSSPSVSTRAQANRKLIRLFEKGDALLTELMDPLVVQFKSPHPSFYKQYLGARAISDLGAQGAVEEVSGSVPNID